MQRFDALRFLYLSTDAPFVGAWEDLAGLGDGPVSFPSPGLSFGGGGGGAAAAAPASQAEDLAKLLCTPEDLANNPSRQEFCMNLAALDGCLMLKVIVPNLSVHGLPDMFNITFPGGCTADFKTLGPFFLRGDVFQYQAAVRCPNTSTFFCIAHYFSPAQPSDALVPGGQGDTFVRASFGGARDDVIACLKNKYGDTLGGLGCGAA